MGIKLDIGGESIALKVGGSFAWSLSYGMAPNTSDLETTVSSVERIREAATYTFPDVRTRQRSDPVGPMTLLMEDDDNGRRMEFKGVYVLTSNRPGKDYNTRIITLADRRWLWERIVVERSYNIRRRTGEFRLVRGERTSIQNSRLRPDVHYRRATLKDGNPWTAEEILRDVLTELCGPSGFVIDGSLDLVDTVEGLELHDLGPDALQRVLAFIPGARVYAGYDGKIHVANLYDQSELPVFEGFGAPNAGDWSFVDKCQLRPKSFNIYSDREVELRFDFVEERGTTTQTNSADQVVQDIAGFVAPERTSPLRPDNWCENVIINPLYYLPLDPLGIQVATQGEAVPIDAFINAVNIFTLASPPGAFGTRSFRAFFPNFVLTKREIREHWLGNWTAFRDKFALDDAQLYNPERLRLLAALRQHYRQTYRIVPEWRQKIRTMTANRTAVMDYETATTAPAACYTQFLTKFSQLGYNPAARGLMATKNDDYGDDLGDKNVSPFEVQIIDSDIGIFRLAAKVDQTGTAETYVIGNVEGELPAADMANAAVFWNQVHLDPTFKLAVILTCTQDTPNNEKRLHKEVVPIEEAAGLLKANLSSSENCGPPVELLQTAETARYAWRDKDAPAIRAAFFDGDEYPTTLMVNPDQIRRLAVASAAQALVPYLDRVEGNVTGPLKQIAPTGNLRSVVHFAVVGQGNKAMLYTTLNAPGDAPSPSVYSLLPEGVRRKVRRLVQV